MPEHEWIRPTRALSPACRWLVQAQSAHLYWNAGCIAYVCRDGARFVSVIQWQQHGVLRGRCGSIAQGMRFVERWVEKRGGLPGSGARRAVRVPGWVIEVRRMAAPSVNYVRTTNVPAIKSCNPRFL